MDLNIYDEIQSMTSYLKLSITYQEIAQFCADKVLNDEQLEASYTDISGTSNKVTQVKVPAQNEETVKNEIENNNEELDENDVKDLEKDENNNEDSSSEENEDNENDSSDNSSSNDGTSDSNEDEDEDLENSELTPLLPS